MSENTNNSFSSKIFSVFAVLGFAALVLIGAWSAYQVVKFAPRLWGGETLSLPNLSGTPEINITFEATELTANTPVDITWETTGNTEDGVFSFAYACREGLRIDVAFINDVGESSFRPLPCNAAYSIPSEDRSLTIVPITTAERFLDGAIAITFTTADGESVRDTKTITVVNEAVSETPTENTSPESVDSGKEGTKQPTTTERKPITEGTVTYGTTKTTTKTTTRTITVPVYPKNDPYGTPDLAVTIISVQGGYGYNAGTAVFRVTNNGTRESGVWNFIASLPILGGYTFTSEYQASILPGGHTDITVRFNKSSAGSQFSVQIDPMGTVYETNEYNNYASSLVY